MNICIYIVILHYMHRNIFKRHFFFICFLILNIGAVVYETTLPIETPKPPIVLILHAPVFGVEVLLEHVCGVTEVQHIIDNCRSFPDSIIVIIYLLFIVVALGSLGFLASIGLFIDYLRHKYAH